MARKHAIYCAMAKGNAPLGFVRLASLLVITTWTASPLVWADLSIVNGSVEGDWTMPPEPTDAFHVKGDITIAALLPIFDAPSCTAAHFNYRLTAWFVEPFLFVLRQHNFALTAFTPAGDKRQLSLGYYVADQCRQGSSPAASATVRISRELYTSHHERPCGQKCSPKPRVIAMVGPSIEEPMVEVTAALNSVHRMVQIATRSTQDLITSRQQNAGVSLSNGLDYLFRASFTNLYEGYAIADILKRFDWSHFGVVASPDSKDGVVGSLRTFLTRTQDFGFCPAFILRTSLDRESAYLEVFEEIRKHSRAKVIVLLASTNPVERLLEFIAKECEQRSMTLPRIWIGNDKWARLTDAVFRKRYRSTVAGVFVANLKVPSYLAGFQFPSQNSSYMYNVSRYMRSITAEQLRENPVVTGDPLLCFVLEHANRCSGICHNETESPQACDDNLTIPDKLDPEGQPLEEMVEPFTMVATVVLVKALQDLFNETVQCHPNKTGQELADIYYDRVYGARLRKAVQDVEVPCAGGGMCRVFHGFPELLPEYHISIPSQNFDKSAWTGASWRSPELSWNGSVDPDKNELILDNSKILFSRSLFPDDDSLPEFVRASDRIPESSCWPLCQPGWGRIQDASLRCCFGCEKCGRNRASPGGIHRCDDCERGYSPSVNHTRCLLLPIVHMNSGVQGVILAVSIITILLFLFTLVVFCYYIETAVVRATDRLLTFLLLFAMVVGLVASDMHLFNPNTGICVASRMMTRIALLASSIIVLVKTSRLARLTSMMKTTKRARTRWTLMTPAQVLFVLILLVFGLILECVMFGFDYPKPEMDYGESLTYEICVTPVATAIVGDVYLIGMILATAVLAFFTRKLPRNYNEARFLYMTALSQCALWSILRPLYYLASLRNQEIVDISLVLFHIVVLWLWLFVPRLDLLLRRRKVSKVSMSSVPSNTRLAVTAPKMPNTPPPSASPATTPGSSAPTPSRSASVSRFFTDTLSRGGSSSNIAKH